MNMKLSQIVDYPKSQTSVFLPSDFTFSQAWLFCF